MFTISMEWRYSNISHWPSIVTLPDIHTASNVRNVNDANFDSLHLKFKQKLVTVLGIFVQQIK